MTKRKNRTPEIQQKTVLFGAADEIEWAESRAEYVPKGRFVATFAIHFPIPSERGVGYVLTREMAGIEVQG